MLPMSNERIEQNADFSLKLRSVGLKDLGPYSCQVRQHPAAQNDLRGTTVHPQKVSKAGPGGPGRTDK